MPWPWQSAEQPSKAIALRPRKSEPEGQPESVPTDLTIPHLAGTQDRLTEEQRDFILQHLAQFRYYSDIQRGMQERWGFTIASKSIDHYAHAAKWRLQLRDARLKYLAKTNSVPIANQVVRMERYETLFQEAVFQKDRQGALAYLRAAAEEMGKLNRQTGDHFYYTNQQVAFFNREQCEQSLAKIAEVAQQQGVIDGTSARLSEAGTAVSSSE